MGTKVKVQNNNFTKYLDASGPVDSIKKQKRQKGETIQKKPDIMYSNKIKNEVM
jgi:hypothetical protein